VAASHSAGALSASVSEDHEVTLPTAEPIRSKHQRKQEQKAARKKNARRQQVENELVFGLSCRTCL